MKQIPFQPGCWGRNAAQSNFCSFTPPGALVAAALHPCMFFHLGETWGGAGSRTLELRVGSSLQPYPALLTKPQTIPVLLEERRNGKQGTEKESNSGWYFMAGLTHSGENTLDVLDNAD